MKINYKGFMRERIRKNPVTINPSASFFQAQNLIQEKGVRHLPVVYKNNRLLGIVTESDIRKAGPSDVDILKAKEAGYLLRKLKVSTFMTPKEKLVTITPDALIEEAIQLMYDYKIGCLPVVEGEKLYGIFTETDAMGHFVDILGLKQQGTRLTIAVEDKPGMLSGILQIFKKHNVNVISIVSPSFMVEGKRIVATRIKTEKYQPIVMDLEEEGYPVLSTGKWPSAKKIMKIQYKGFMRERIQKNPVWISPDTSFNEARNLIHEKGVRHLPVVDKNGKLVGIVTDRDIREAAPSDATTFSIQELNYLLAKLKVSAFMTPKEKLITITPDTLIEEAVQLMHDHKIGCLPVLEGGKLYGIFTETDSLHHLVDVFGLKQKGTRLSVALGDKPGTMLGVFEIFEKHNVNVISLVTPSFMVEGKRIAAIRIRTEKYGSIVKDLEKTDYVVLSIGKWPSV